MNKTPLRFLAINNYKNLYLPEPIYLSNLNIFIGSNASGKSNFINCLKFLKDCLNNITDEHGGVSSFEDAIAKLGGNRILDSHVESAAKIRFSYCFLNIVPTETNSSNQIKDNCVILDLKLYVEKQNLRASIIEENLYSGEELYDIDHEVDFNMRQPPFYYYQLHGKKLGEGIVAVYDNNLSTTYPDFENISNIPTNSLGLFIIPIFLYKTQYIPEEIPVHEIRKYLINSIYKWQFYNANNMDLNIIRIKEPRIGLNDIYLSPSGDNLALVLDNLINQDINFEESINLAMKSILPKTRRVRPGRAGRLSLTVEWYMDGIKEPFYLNEMSDGTVRMLCWAIILHSPLIPALLVIDEPELGLHISWMPILAEWIKRAATRTQVIITTHSPDLLDHFTDCLENVLCFYSENRTHFSIKHLSQEMLDSKLEQGWQLGDLYRVGDPSIGGWPW